jgi:WD40 repeat protein
MAVSLAAVAAAVIVVSGVFVALQAEQVRSREWTSVTQCLISRDGKRAIGLSWNVPTTLQGWSHRLSFHSTASGEQAGGIAWPELSPSCVAAGATDDEMFVGGWDGTIHAVRGAALEADPVLVGRHADGVIDMKASADGRHLISLSPTGMCAWDLATKQLLWRWSEGQISCFCIHPDSSRLLCGMNDGRVVVLDLLDGWAERELLENPPRWPVHDLDFTADGRLLSITHSVGDVRILSFEPGQPYAPANANPAPFCPTGWPRIARFSSCGKMLVTTAAGDRPELVIWDVSSGKQVTTLQGHRGIVLGAQFAADGRLFSWGNDATIRIWDIERGRAAGVLSLSTASDPLSWARLLASWNEA